MTLAAELIKTLAPTGTLRASINLGNPILAKRGPDGQPMGVSIDLAQGLGRLLGVGVELVVFDTAAQSVEAVNQEQADVGFFAVDPARGAGIHFTAPYVLIEGAYLVREDSPLVDNSEVDRAGHRVMVGQGSAYDLFLSRALQAATIVRAPTSPAVVQAFLEQGADVAAGVKPQIAAEATRLVDSFGRPHQGAGYGPTHIFNLGHGISQHTPPEHVQALVEAVHSASRAIRR